MCVCVCVCVCARACIMFIVLHWLCVLSMCAFVHTYYVYVCVCLSFYLLMYVHIFHRVRLYPEATQAASKLRAFLDLPCPLTTTAGVQREGRQLASQLKDLVAPKLSLCDLNYALYRCDTEERDDGQGGGVYDIPGYGRLVYCGLQGWLWVGCLIINWSRGFP